MRSTVGTPVILSAAKNLASVAIQARFFAALRMTAFRPLPTIELLPNLKSQISESQIPKSPNPQIPSLSLPMTAVSILLPETVLIVAAVAIYLAGAFFETQRPWSWIAGRRSLAAALLAMPRSVFRGRYLILSRLRWPRHSWPRCRFCPTNLPSSADGWHWSSALLLLTAASRHRLPAPAKTGPRRPRHAIRRDGRVRRLALVDPRRTDARGRGGRPGAAVRGTGA